MLRQYHQFRNVIGSIFIYHNLLYLLWCYFSRTVTSKIQFWRSLLHLALVLVLAPFSGLIVFSIVMYRLIRNNNEMIFEVLYLFHQLFGMELLLFCMIHRVLFEVSWMQPIFCHYAAKRRYIDSKLQSLVQLSYGIDSFPKVLLEAMEKKDVTKRFFISLSSDLLTIILLRFLHFCL